MNHNIQIHGPAEVDPQAEAPLISNRARELIRMKARRDADGSHQYQGPTYIKRLLGKMEAELVAEWETALRRHTRLKEVIGG